MSGIVGGAGSKSGIIGETELDYEEGLWTIAFAASGSGTITVNSGYDLASYTKVGRLVTINAWTIVSSVSSPSGEFEIRGLPFVPSTSNEDSDYSAGSIAYCQGWNALTSAHSMSMWTGPGFAYFRVQSHGGVDKEAIADHAKANSAMLFTATYLTDE